MVLGVRVLGSSKDGSQFDELTHTVDIALDGARLGGMERLSIHPGDVIEVRRRNRHAKFRVMWVGQPGTSRTGHVGVQAIDAPPNFWGLEVPKEGEAPAVPIHGRVVPTEERAV